MSELKKTACIRIRFKAFILPLDKIELKELAGRLANNLPDATLETVMGTFGSKARK